MKKTFYAVPAAVTLSAAPKSKTPKSASKTAKAVKTLKAVADYMMLVKSHGGVPSVSFS